MASLPTRPPPPPPISISVSPAFPGTPKREVSPISTRRSEDEVDEWDAYDDPQDALLNEAATSSRTDSPPRFPNFSSANIPTPETRMVVALDYGTTFSGIAYLSVASRQKDQDLDALADDIRVLQGWPTHESEKVPSEISYSPSPKGCRQWGYDIDDNSRVLKWTKLELEETRGRSAELRTLAETLWGMRLLDLSEDAVIRNDIPRHLAKEPEDIVKDYLDNIAEQTLEEICTQVGRRVADNIPIDMVITHPAKWSDKALNSTYRAVRAAFKADLFPKIRNFSFVSEPEACAHYTLREALREDRVNFRKNDCFIVVDAGGGTVDLASYKVVSLDLDQKQFKLEQIGYPIGDNCGATCIDRAFEQFIEQKLGPEDWEKLIETDAQDQATGGHSIIKPKLRMLHGRFEGIKHQFDGKDQKLGFPIQLPRGIGTTDDEERGIMNGAIKITVDDLKTMFKHSVDKTLVLISQAATHIQVIQKLKIRKIFLSGGFGRSPYLYERVKAWGMTSSIQVDRGDDCWSAVTRGAIIKSLGVHTSLPPIIRPCPRHYGIKVRTQYAPYNSHRPSEVDVDVEGVKWATDQIRWFINKGDALFPGKPMVSTYDCHWSMRAAHFPAQNGTGRALAQNPGSVSQRFDKRGGGNIMPPPPPPEVFREVVFVASSADEPPTRFAAVNKGRDTVVTLKCNLTKIPDTNRSEFTNKDAGKFYKFWVKVEIHVTEKCEVKITSGGKVLASAEVPLGESDISA
ncbi:hypothetical protein GE21DRAFT_3741 [Neurospora crassa]|uniref:Hsp70 family chaperone n=1 Tax=Neurospora crassa (strain ATCC 24698 / 74-OR23-1A / CBS 708.71 / DSM 1257 / FGSC 987) TaxID=367110 RepID=Q7SC10_NEUCR|nr:hypothetical protein NCU09471 [Neurospora crassa OR74A]EAA33990.2 hypothetical protein NCU09471 [Neurospora crassa OR74A]KHE83356.1 hypothetical protein GE21DRAFT_3741 [Neurospora crassa]|eukprot:XP_963226.2 hypothetical protein NCU09471 [Neurospora crassa OR74A]